MAVGFNFSDYPQAPETGGITGNPSVDPSQLQTQPAVAPTSPTAPAGGQDAAAYFQSKYPAGSSLSPQQLLADEADLKAHGITLIKNAAGQPGKVQLADGSAYDVIQGAGAGTNKAQWNQIAGPGGAPTGGAGGYGTVPGLGFGSFTTPIGLFTPPTEQDALNSPGLQFALDEANRMGQNSAAAKGTLLNGRFQQALAASNIQNALQGYGDVYNRAANAYGLNYQTQTGNQDRPFAKYLSLADLGQRSAAAS
jgi:hypothetical protein